MEEERETASDGKDKKVTEKGRVIQETMGLLCIVLYVSGIQKEKGVC